MLIALGGAVLITVSLGPMAVEMGNVSVLVWALTVGVGAVQCLLLGELSSRFPGRAGGTPQFAYRSVPRGSSTLGALSSWCYWYAWTPGIAVNLILAALYLRAVVWPSAPVVPVAAVIGVALYALNSMGLRTSMRASAVLAVLVLVPLTLIVATPLIEPHVFHAHNLLPLALPPGSPHGAGGIAALVAKWTFVAAWSAYGGEMASTVSAEVRELGWRMPRTMAIAAGVCVATFVLVPVSLLGIVGAQGLADDPLTAFVPAARLLLGPAAETAVGLTLAVALVLGAQAFIFGSSRTVYQLSLDGHLPRAFARVNRRGVPVGSIALDTAVIAVMLAVFGTHVVDVVAAANVGYLVVFILMPMAYLVLRHHPGGDPGGTRLPRAFVPVAVALIAFNAAVLVLGGLQWGGKVMLTGALVSALILPMSWLTRLAHRRSRA